MSKSYFQHSPRSGLSDSDVLDIRAASATSSIRQIAKYMDVPKSTVHDIISGKTWSHVPNPVLVHKNYSVFPDGRVWSNKTNQFLIKKLNKDGTLTVDITINGTKKTTTVAALIAKAFYNSKSTKLTYVDGDKTNVHFTNITIR